MSLHGQMAVTLLCVVVIAYVLALTVRRRLSEAWCVLWIAALVLAAVLINIPALLSWLTRLIGARYPASTLSLVGLFLLAMLAIHSAGEASVHSRQIVALVQEVALLRRAVEDLCGASRPGSAPHRARE